jgi:hypothetical protein
MNDNLLIALQITLVGMGLVFALICALWLGMGLLVRLAADKATDELFGDAFGIRRPTTDDRDGEEMPVVGGPSAVDANERDLRRRVAVVAAALVLAEPQAAPLVFSIPPTASVSPWQAVARGNQLRSRGRVRR